MEYELKLTQQEINEVIQALAAPLVARHPTIAKISSQVTAQMRAPNKQEETEERDNGTSTKRREVHSRPARA